MGLPQYQNVSVIRTNAAKFLLNYCRKGQVTAAAAAATTAGAGVAGAGTDSAVGAAVDADAAPARVVYGSVVHLGGTDVLLLPGPAL